VRYRPAQWCIAPAHDASQREQSASMGLALFDICDRNQIY
jgi:hypothetical protein